MNDDVITDKNKVNDDNENDSYKIIGDIDELIFPDDEPYYISER